MPYNITQPPDIVIISGNSDVIDVKYIFTADNVTTKELPGYFFIVLTLLPIAFVIKLRIILL